MLCGAARCGAERAVLWIDRDAMAASMSRTNAERAGVADFTEFQQCAIGDLVPPAGAPGLVMLNPPYGSRIGDMKQLLPLYRAIGQTLLTRFSGWRVGLVTIEASLARRRSCRFCRRLRRSHTAGCA